MIGSFWNLCRACPSMPLDKVNISIHSDEIVELYQRPARRCDGVELYKKLNIECRFKLPAQKALHDDIGV